MTYKTQAIILRHSDWQDYNRIYTLLTKDRGKLSAIARGIKKIKSKQASKLKPFSVIEVMIAHGRKIDTLATAETVHHYNNLTDNLLVLGLASFCTELVDNLTRESLPDLKIYNLLQETLHLLNTNSQASDYKLKSLAWFFALRLIDYLGYGVDWHTCSQCHKAIPAQNLYHLFPESGGLICHDHKITEGLLKVSSTVVDFLRNNITVKLQDFWHISLDHNLAHELIKSLKPLVFSHLHSELKTERFLEKL